MSFGTNLERLRKVNKVSQTALGKVLGITQQMVSNYEKGSSQPNIEILVKIADFFGVSIDELVDYYPINKKDTDDNKTRLIDYYDRLSESEREKCFTIMQTIINVRE